jgi:hypothetical protein
MLKCLQRLCGDYCGRNFDENDATDFQAVHLDHMTLLKANPGGSAVELFRRHPTEAIKKEILTLRCLWSGHHQLGKPSCLNVEAESGSDLDSDSDSLSDSEADS